MVSLGAIGLAARIQAQRNAPAEACLARLTAIDNARFDRANRPIRFDGTLLLRPSTLYVEGMLDLGDQSFRIHRLIDWKTRWFEPTSRTFDAVHIYYGDTLPADMAARLPLLGDRHLELRFARVDDWMYGVFANDVFITYCRRMPAIDVALPGDGARTSNEGTAAPPSSR